MGVRRPPCFVRDWIAARVLKINNRLGHTPIPFASAGEAASAQPKTVEKLWTQTVETAWTSYLDLFRQVDGSPKTHHLHASVADSLPDGRICNAVSNQRAPDYSMILATADLLLPRTHGDQRILLLCPRIPPNHLGRKSSAYRRTVGKGTANSVQKRSKAV